MFRSRSRVRPPGKVTLYRQESLSGNTGELRPELRGVTGVRETGSRTDDLKSFGRNIESVAQPAKQQTHFRACRASVQMRFVKDDEKFFAGIILQPVAGLIEDRPLDGSH